MAKLGGGGPDYHLEQSYIKPKNLDAAANNSNNKHSLNIVLTYRGTQYLGSVVSLWTYRWMGAF